MLIISKRIVSVSHVLQINMKLLGDVMQSGQFKQILAR